MKHWEGGFAKDGFRSTTVKETESTRQSKMIQWGRVLVFLFCVILQGQGSGTKACAAHLHHGAVSADVVTLTFVEPLAALA